MRRRGAPPSALGHGDLVGDQLVDGDRGVDEAVDEGGVGAVLEQAADEVGEQRLVGADRRVDAAGAVELVLADDLVVEGLAHAVQALELVVLRRRPSSWTAASVWALWVANCG